MSTDALKTLHLAWQQGQAYEPIVSLQSQSQWAFTALVVALSLTGLFILSDKKGIVNTIQVQFIAILASICFGFGSIFLIDAVGVYT